MGSLVKKGVRKASSKGTSVPSFLFNLRSNAMNFVFLELAASLQVGACTTQWKE